MYPIGNVLVSYAPFHDYGKLFALFATNDAFSNLCWTIDACRRRSGPLQAPRFTPRPQSLFFLLY